MKTSEMFYEYANSYVNDTMIPIDAIEKYEEIRNSFTIPIWDIMKRSPQIEKANMENNKKFMLAWSYFMAVVAELNDD